MTDTPPTTEAMRQAIDHLERCRLALRIARDEAAIARRSVRLAEHNLDAAYHKVSYLAVTPYVKERTNA